MNNQSNYLTRRRRLVRAYIAAMDAGENNRVNALRRAYWRLIDEHRSESKRETR